MTTIIRLRGRVNIAIGLFMVLLLAVPMHGVRADNNSNPGILPPNSHAFGNTYGGWSGAWWQYAESQALQPIADPTGATCRAGQSDPVFFLVGTNNASGVATRDQCTVPAGKALSFPLVNAEYVHVPCNGMNASVCDTNNTPQKAWDALQSFVQFRSSFSALFASVDGVSIGNLDPASTPYLACAGPVSGCAPTFSVTTPATDLFGNPPGTYLVAVADGFYLLLAPLTPGAHTITFGGAGQFRQDITYHLVVTSS
jgi:hypothetical protein